MVLSDIITTGLNNPECSFFVGSFVGQASLFRFTAIYFILHIIFKFIDKLVFDKLIKKIKGYRKK